MTLDERARRAGSEVQEGLSAVEPPPSEAGLRAALHRRRRRAARALVVAAVVVAVGAMPAVDALRDDGAERVDVVDRPTPTTSPTVPFPIQGLRFGSTTSELVVSFTRTGSCTAAYRADVDVRPRSGDIPQQVEIEVRGTLRVARHDGRCSQEPSARTVLAVLPEPLEAGIVVDGVSGRRLLVMANHLLEPGELPEGWRRLTEWGHSGPQGPTWTTWYGPGPADDDELFGPAGSAVTVVQGALASTGALLPEDFAVTGRSTVRGHPAETLRSEGAPGGIPALRWLDEQAAVAVNGPPGMSAEELHAFADALVESPEPREVGPGRVDVPSVDGLPRFEATVLPPGFALNRVARTSLPLIDRQDAFEGYEVAFRPVDDRYELLSLRVFGDGPSGEAPFQLAGADRRTVRGRSGYVQRSARAFTLAWSEHRHVHLVVSTRGTIPEEEVLAFAEGIRERA